MTSQANMTQPLGASRVAEQEGRRRPSARRRQTSRLGSGMPFALPFIIVALLFLIGPTLYGLGMSFTSVTLMGGGEYVGFENFSNALGDPAVWDTLGNTLAFTVMSTVPLVLVALIMALLVFTGLPGQWLWRLAFFAPFLLPVAVVVDIFVWLFQPDIGYLNHILGWLGVGGVGWLTDADIAMWSMVLLTLWWTVGFNFLLYLSALQAIPDQLYEAASIDGAGVWRRLFSITIPQLGGTTVLVVILQVLASLKVFDQMFIAFGGGAGPDGATRPILQYVYDTGFVGYRMGYAAAISYVFLAMIIIVTLLMRRLSTARKGN